MSFTIVIPARFASTRLPGKPLAMIGEKTMIQRVYEQASKSDASQVIVATDDERVFAAVSHFGGNVCMTAANHVSGTDRIQEVAQLYQLAPDEIVVNVQGDEPLIPPAVINQVAKNLQQHPQAAAATLSEAIYQPEDFSNPNIVKVVNDVNKMALYFSRASIPFVRDASSLSSNVKAIADYLPQRHIGIYAYRVELLHQFIKWPPSVLESIESLEQLRILSNGKQIHVEESCEAVPGGVDTPEDLERIRREIS